MANALIQPPGSFRGTTSTADADPASASYSGVRAAGAAGYAAALEAAPASGDPKLGAFLKTLQSPQARGTDVSCQAFVMGAVEAFLGSKPTGDAVGKAM